MMEPRRLRGRFLSSSVGRRRTWARWKQHAPSSHCACCGAFSDSRRTSGRTRSSCCANNCTCVCRAFPAWRQAGRENRIHRILRMSMATEKTFYLETFGCQMNAHDSEKVIGTLRQQGYRQVEAEEDAGLILYNTCSIRDKAEQKVFNRLADYKKYRAQGKQFGVLGCVAQQEGEKIFERAPYVSLVCGSASYRNLPSRLVQLETGSQRVTGLDDRLTDTCFETEFTARTNPHRGYITIIEGCDKFCAYCVVPYTRGKERSRTSASVLAETRQLADLGYTEIQLLGQNVNSYN